MTEQKRREICVDTVQKFKNCEWFRDVVVHDSHPITGEPTLEIKVNYVPMFDKKEVMNFALSHNLGYRFTVVDKAGNPVE